MVVCLCECVSLAYNQVSQFSAVTQSFPTLSDPVDGNTPGLSVLHYLPELAQAHLHRVGDASQPSHPVLAPSLALSLSRHQALFSSESALHIRWPKYCIFSFSINPSNEYSRLISLLSKGFSRVFCNTTVQKHQFFGAQLPLWSNSHIHGEGNGNPLMDRGAWWAIVHGVAKSQT